MPGTHSDDENLMLLLVSTWELQTGRTLRGAPVAELTEQELIEFWADDNSDWSCRNGLDGGNRTLYANLAPVEVVQRPCAVVR
jgi:hypothetical protein